MTTEPMHPNIIEQIQIPGGNRLLDVAYGAETSRRAAWAQKYETDREITKLEARLELAVIENKELEADYRDAVETVRILAAALYAARHGETTRVETDRRFSRRLLRLAWREVAQ